MARARNIKPGFFTNDELAECDPLARILFIGLWCIADRAGRLEDRPKKIKAEVLPYDGANVDKLLDQLAAKKFIIRYSVDGNSYIQVAAFEKHQNPHIKEAESTIPAPDKHSASAVQAPDSAQPKPERAGLIPDSLNRIPDSISPNPVQPPPASRASAPKKTAMPADFGISDRVRAWALENKHGQLDKHLAAFRLACQAKGYAYADWDAAFMNAIRNNWAKLEPSPQQVAATRKPDRFELANLEYEKKYGTPETVKALAAKLTGAAA